METLQSLSQVFQENPNLIWQGIAVIVVICSCLVAQKIFASNE